MTVGSKKFTESVILGEALAQLAADAGSVGVEHKRDLGGSRVLFSATQRGDIDAYPEYTGTLRFELLAGEDAETVDEIRAALAERGLGMSDPIGFENTYAIGVMPATKAEYGLETVGDLRNADGLRYGLTNEFMDREDGWPGLRDAYGLPATAARGMDHDLAYRALEAGQIDVMDVYSTDAEIAALGVELLDDDRGYFPEYAAVIVYRLDLEEREPGALASMLRLVGAIDEPAMRRLNEAVKIGGAAEGDAAEGFLRDALGVESGYVASTRADRLLLTTREQLVLVGLSLGGALLIGVPMGVVAAWDRRLGAVVLGVAGVLQTVPALAMLVVLIPAFGVGAGSAVVALVVYSVLPIVRNVHAGLAGVPGDVRESASAIGLGRWRRLWSVEMPMALPTALAGVKTAAVINIGTATLAALIGAGGYGQPILTGIRLDDFGLILEGALPAALMALVAQWGFGVFERVAVSRGLRG